MTTKLITEDNVQLALYKHYTNLGYEVQREVKTKAGYIDLVIHTPKGKILIETKHYRSIKHAIGQLINYYKYHQDAIGLLCIYFTYDLSYKNVNSSIYELSVPNSNLSVSIINYLDVLDIDELEAQYDTNDEIDYILDENY